jgi:hypothetical protein
MPVEGSSPTDLDLGLETTEQGGEVPVGPAPEGEVEEITLEFERETEEEKPEPSPENRPASSPPKKVEFIRTPRNIPKFSRLRDKGK